MDLTSPTLSARHVLGRRRFAVHVFTDLVGAPLQLQRRRASLRQRLWAELGVPSRGAAYMAIPALDSFKPWIQVGAFTTRPFMYSSGYSPSDQTLPSLSCAKKASSASSSFPAL